MHATAMRLTHMLRSRRLPAHLVRLVLAALVPLLLLAVVMIVLFAQQARQTAEHGMRETVRALALAVDSEVGQRRAILDVLATSHLLASGDFAGFHQQCLAALRGQPDGAWIALADPAGRELLHTREPFGTPPPRRGAPGTAATSDLFRDPATQRPAITVERPVVDAGRVAYVLSLGIPADALGQFLSAHPLPPGWIAGVNDRQHVIMARTQAPERFVGQRATPLMVAKSAATADGWFRNTSKEGTTIYTAFRRARETGWTVVLMAPAAVIDAPLYRSLALVLGGGGLLAATAVGLAVRVGRHIAAPMAGLVAAAQVLGRGHEPVAPASASPVEDIEAVHRALVEASTLLHQREAALRASEEHFRALNETLEQRVTERTAQLEAANQELVNEIAERARAEEALRASERKFRSVVESATDAIVLADGAGNMLAWNHGAQAIFGYREAEIVGQPLTRLMPERFREAHQRGLERLRSTGESRVMGRIVQLQGLRKDGSEFPLELALSSWQAGADTCYSGIIRDITVRQQAEEAIRTLNHALEQRVAELKAANQELATLSYSIAHDLRAPLRAMHSFSHILLEDYAPQLDAEAQGYLQRVSANALRMGRLIDDLLAFGHLSHKPLQKRPVAPAELVREVWEDLQPEYAQRRVDLTVGESPVCQADPALLKQVWANLLGNALKFTRGRPVARIEVGSDEQAGARVYFVRDNGAGFSMDHADNLFGVFQRLHRAEEYEGTGVGLAIVQRIVHRHGGRIWAESAVDQGATFFFTLGP